MNHKTYQSCFSFKISYKIWYGHLLQMLFDILKLSAQKNHALFLL